VPNNAHNRRSILTRLSPSKAGSKLARLPLSMVGSKAELLPALLPAAILAHRTVSRVGKGLESLNVFRVPVS